MQKPSTNTTRTFGERATGHSRIRGLIRGRFAAKNHPRIFHEYPNAQPNIRAFVVSFVDGNFARNQPRQQQVTRLAQVAITK